jgi:hypothetical protein
MTINYNYLRANLPTLESDIRSLVDKQAQLLPEFETVRECVDAAFEKCPNVFA